MEFSAWQSRRIALRTLRKDGRSVWAAPLECHQAIEGRGPELSGRSSLVRRLVPIRRWLFVLFLLRLLLLLHLPLLLLVPLL